MHAEIAEQPAALEATLGREWACAESLRKRFAAHPVRAVLIAARGTSDNAAQFGRYLIEITTGIPVSLAAPSVTTLYRAKLRLSDVLVVAVSQSGESTDVNLVLESAKEQNAFTIGITNEKDSALATLGDETILVHAGRERSVAATKTYTGQMLAFYLLAYGLGAAIQRSELQRLPEYAQAALSTTDEMEAHAERCQNIERAVCVGRGLNYANSFESALKLMETCYVVAERFSPADLLHGPIAMVEESFPAFAFCPSGVTRTIMQELLQRLSEVRAETLTISDAGDPVGKRGVVIPADLRHAGTLPEDVYTPIPYVIPMQLFAASLSQAKGLNPDAPRSLTKVTRTI